MSGLLRSSGTVGTVVTTGGETFVTSVLSAGNQFIGALDALRQDDLAKVLAEPNVVTVSGRPAYFNAGGEFPVLVPQSLGTVSIQYRPYGTQVDFVTIVLGNGRVRLEVRPRVSEIDAARSVTVNGLNVPALKVREIDTGVEMQTGQTLAIGGLVQNRVESQSRGFPGLKELPYVGALFRRQNEQINEVELLILVTPELIEGADPHEMPKCLPGTQTTSPTDWQFYVRGHMEVPKICPPGHEASQMPHISDVPTSAPKLEQRQEPVQTPPPAPPEARSNRRASPPPTTAKGASNPQANVLRIVPLAPVERTPPTAGTPLSQRATSSLPVTYVANRPQVSAGSGLPGFVGPTGYERGK